MKGKIHGSSAKALLQVIDSFDSVKGADEIRVVVYIADIMDDNRFWMVEDGFIGYDIPALWERYILFLGIST